MPSSLVCCLLFCFLRFSFKFVQMLRYMPMGSGPSEARRGLVSPIVGVIDSWEPSVMLGTELGSSGKAVCTLNHQVRLSSPWSRLFFLHAKLTFHSTRNGSRGSLNDHFILSDLPPGIPMREAEKDMGDASHHSILQN